MPVSVEYRQEVLKKVRETHGSTAKPREEAVDLDRELASLYSTLGLAWLAQSQYDSGSPFRGYLYNVGFDTYVTNDGVWLYSSSATTDGALLWTLQKNGQNLYLSTFVDGTQMYFNWRNSTGACKLYPTYDPITVNRWISDNIFMMLNPSVNEQIGTWSPSDNELYNRANVVNTDFRFSYIPQESLSADDRLIYDTYLKENSSG
ncbi:MULTISPECIES: hypothetical protein [unclassified Pseudofrankia]|uniref:hypothetical protein n=1 Tax=unclassified Pseudofrankia TaxID=2994372 RepID=UPI001041EF27|nr:MULTISPECIES: hypothetical protein [unclassified Pseudofrankia]MDT3444353.1 hypothetical protein [Pseudofrankia sp. BMG5.37]